MANAWESAPVVGSSAPAWASAPVVNASAAPEAPTDYAGAIKQGVGNVVAGAIRGAGSIGATLLTPIDAAARAAGIQNDYIGRTDRRQAMDEGLHEMGAQPDSLLYQGGKLGGEIAGTAGAGGVVSNGLRLIPGIARSAPNLLRAIETGGMTTGAAGNALANAGTRVLGGAITGGASAGLVNPEDAGTGAVVGGVAPVVLKVAGAAGAKVGNLLRGPEQGAGVSAAVDAARKAGYVIPPTQANPTLLNRVLEGVSGKVTTAQNASAKNAAVTSGLAAKEIGLAPDTQLSPEVLDRVRAEAGKAYEAVSNLGAFDAKGAKLPSDVSVNTFTDPLTLSKRTEVDAGEVVRAWKQANADATSYYRAYGRDANPETLAKAKQAASSAKDIDSFLTTSLQNAGEGDKADALKAARVLIAKTHSVEGAMNPVTGAVDARKLAAQLAKGKPLSGGLKDAADFAGRFPKANQQVEAMGSLPGTSPLDWHAAAATSMVTGNPLAMLGTAARPIVRATTLSPLVQNRLVQGSRGPASQAAINLLQTTYRGAPLIGNDQ